MTAKRETQRTAERRRRTDESSRATRRRPADSPPRTRGAGFQGRSSRSAPQTTPIPRPSRATSTSQAKARAKARKAKAPKAVRPPLKERLIARLSRIDLSPRTLAAKVPFVVLVIGALGIGLGLTLWLSTDSAERSYELGNARETNRALGEQKNALERDVLQAQAAPALAEAARNLGMIPSRDTAHLVQDPSGNWVVVGTPKPAEGVPLPPLNTPLPVEKPTPPAQPVDPREVSRLVPRPPAAPLAGAAVPGGPEVLVRTPAPNVVAGLAPGLPAAPGLPPADVIPAAPSAEALPPGGPPPDATAPAGAPAPGSPAAAALSVPADAQQAAPVNVEQSTVVPPQAAGPAT